VDAQIVVRRLLMLASVYVVPVVVAFQRINDPDVWWHLRAGAWIVARRMIPREDPFSVTGGPWIAYSWLFEVLLYGSYAALGFVGIVLIPAVMSVAILLGLHLLVQRARAPFWLEFVLLVCSVVVLLPVLVQPRSWLFTLLFTMLELHVLAAYRDGAPARCLLVLPPLLALWANVHVQFVYGFALLGFALVDAIVERVTAHARTSASRILPLVITATAAALAIRVNPYGIHIIEPVVDAVLLTDPFLYISELNAMTFRAPTDWLVLALALGTAFALGWRRAFVPLPVLVFLFGCFIGFRARRDVWLLTAGASWLISSSYGARNGDSFRLTRRRLAGMAVLVAAVSGAVAAYGLSNTKLESSLRRTFPVVAAAAVDQGGYHGSLFNTYDWGGYLMWRLPHLKVSMDGRNTLHGDTKVWRSISTWAGREGWDADPDLLKACVVVGPRAAPLTSLLRRDGRFSVAHEDELAVVFARSACQRRATR
jgi:hypothetical protein